MDDRVTPQAGTVGDEILLARQDMVLSEPYVAPEGGAEVALASLWARQLKLDAVGSNDDFFELGGDSFAAVQLALAIERTFGQTFTAAQFIEFPSIATQARHLAAASGGDSGKARLPSCLTLGHEGKGGRPLFMVHGALGMTFVDRRFLDGLGADRTVYLFQAPGLDGKTAPLRSVEEFASTYAAAMRSVQADGPYAVSANCASGVIGLAIALALQAQGEKVDPLVLLDPHPVPASLIKLYPGLSLRHLNKKPTLALHLRKYFARLRNFLRGEGFVIEAADAEWRNSIGEAARRHAVARNRLAKLQGFDGNLAALAGAERDLAGETLEKLDAAIRSYVPQGRLDGTVRILGSFNRSFDDPEQLRFWRAAAAAVEVRRSPGTHQEMFTGNAADTGRFVRAMMDSPAADPADSTN